MRPGADGSVDQHEWAVEVARPDGGVDRRGCRQRLGSDVTPQIRLGQMLEVRIDDAGGVLLVDGDLTEAEVHHKVLDPPPDDGIADGGHDLAKERRKAVGARLHVLAAERATVFGVPTTGVDLRVRVEPDHEAPFETTLKNVGLPFYATHLAAAGAVLAGTSRPGRQNAVRVDWPASAVADPGLGLPPALD